MKRYGAMVASQISRDDVMNLVNNLKINEKWAKAMFSICGYYGFDDSGSVSGLCQDIEVISKVLAEDGIEAAQRKADLFAEFRGLDNSSFYVYVPVDPNKVTERQIEYINGLLNKCKKEMDIDFENLTKKDASALIDELKKEADAIKANKKRK